MADLVDWALTNVSDVKESLGITNNSKDNLIIRKINQATHMIETFCALPEDHHFKETTYTNEEYDPTHTNQLILRMRPVSTLSSFQQRTSSENIDNWDSVDSKHYFLDKPSGVVEGLRRIGGRWNRWRVTYTAGYDPIPADLAEAAVMVASALVDSASTGGQAIKKKQEGQRSLEYFPSSQQASIIEQIGVDDMISKYVRLPLQDDV